MIELDFSCALAPFTLRVRARLPAPVTAVMGPSGAGKTSLLEAIAGVRTGVSGRIAAGGVAFLDGARRLPPERRRVGYVPQDAGLFPHLSARDNVRFGARGPSPRVDAAIEVLGIGPLLARMPPSLSGGEKQRVALARALASEPVLLLLDEPLAGLDPSQRERILPYLLRVRDEWNVPILYVTHNPGEALALAGEVLLLERGEVVGQAPPADLLGAPAMAPPPDEGLENVLAGRVVEVDEAGGTVRVEVAGGLFVSAPWSVGRAARAGGHAGRARGGRADRDRGAARAVRPQRLRRDGHERRPDRAGRAGAVRAFAGFAALARARDAGGCRVAFAVDRAAVVARREEPLGALALGAFAVWRFSTASLCSSRSASVATKRAPTVPWAAMRSPQAMAAARSRGLRLPIWRSAQLTAFFTKLRGSPASRSISGKNKVSVSSDTSLSCTAIAARSAKAARLTNSSLRPLHARIFVCAYGVRSNRFRQQASQTAHESKSRAQRSICRGVTRSASSTSEARMRASRMPVAQSCCARVWSWPISFASSRSAGAGQP